MCNHCSSDPRDDLAMGSKALSGLADLVSDIQMGGKGFERTRPEELSQLLDMVRLRVSSAAERLQNYVPRESPYAAK